MSSSGSARNELYTSAWRGVPTGDLDVPSFPKPCRYPWRLLKRAAGHVSPEGGLRDTQAAQSHQRGATADQNADHGVEDDEREP